MRKGDARPLQAPGSFWEYNDVRINQLSLALRHLFRRPLPEVFREAIARPCGASNDWCREGYENSWVLIDGQRIQSVPGGTHWGGGLAIGSADQALIGQRMLDQSRVGSQRALSKEWVRRMQTPCAIAPWYGKLTWLNPCVASSPARRPPAPSVLALAPVWSGPIPRAVWWPWCAGSTGPGSTAFVSAWCRPLARHRRRRIEPAA